MSLQIAILKVLSSHPGGHASITDIKSDLAVLTASGREWNDRVKDLAQRAPNLDIFSQRYVSRDPSGWTLADKGRDFLKTLERPAPAAEPEPQSRALRDYTPQVRRTSTLDTMRPMSIRPRMPPSRPFR